MADKITRCKGCGQTFKGSKAAGMAWHLAHKCPGK